MKKKSVNKMSPKKTAKRRKISKKVWIRCGCVAGAVVLLAAILFFVPRKNAWFSLDCFRARAAVSGFLKDVKAQDFEGASEYVAFSSEDGGSLPSDEENRQIWVARISGLRQGIKQNYLRDYSKLSVVKVDGEMQVKVVLDVTYQNAKDLSNGETVITLVKREGDWKISSVSEYEYEKKSLYEKALSGILPDEE